MFGSVKKIISAFETRRQARPVSLPPASPQPPPSSVGSSASSPSPSPSSPSSSFPSPLSSSSPSSSSAVALSKGSVHGGPVNHVSKPASHPIRPASPCRPAASGGPAPLSQSEKRLARLSVPPAADRIPSSSSSVPASSPPPKVESVAKTTDRWNAGQVKGAGDAGAGAGTDTVSATVGRVIPRMRVRDSWPIGREALVDRWGLYARTIPLRADRHNQARCTGASTNIASSSTATISTSAAVSRSTSSARLNASAIPGPGSRSSLNAAAGGGPKLCSTSTQTLPTELILCSSKGVVGSTAAAASVSALSCTRTAHSETLVASSNLFNSALGPTAISSVVGPTDTSAVGPTASSAVGPSTAITSAMGPSDVSTVGPSDGSTVRPILTSATRLPTTTGHIVTSVAAQADTTGQSVTVGRHVTSFEGQTFHSAGPAGGMGPTVHSSSVGRNISSTTGPTMDSSQGSLTEPNNISRILSIATAGPNIMPAPGPVGSSTTGPGSQCHSTRPLTATARAESIPPTLHCSASPAKAQATVAPSPGPGGLSNPSNPQKEPLFLGHSRPLGLHGHAPFGAPQETTTLQSPHPASDPQAPGSPGTVTGGASVPIQTHPAVHRLPIPTGSFSSTTSSPQGPARPSCCPASCTLAGPLCPGGGPIPGHRGPGGHGRMGETKRSREQGGLALLPQFRHKLDLPKEARRRVGSETAFLSLVLFCRGGTGNSAMAIDNKIEQAMDLVKTHLMLAVREEVELLREQIKELTEKNAQLERENYILKALRDRH